MSVLLFSLLFLFTTFTLTQAQSYDPSKEPPFDKAKIMKDLDKLSINDSYYYAHDLNMEKRYKAAIFALEYTINKNPNEIKNWPNFFGFLGRLYINLKDFNKAREALSLEYRYPTYIEVLPKDKEELRKYEIGNGRHYILVLDEARINDESLFTMVLESARQFLIKYPDAIEEEKKEIMKIVKNYESEIESQAIFKSEQEKIMKLAQSFLNEISNYIIQKNEKEMYSFFTLNTTTEEWAKNYSIAFKNHFFNFKNITFKVNGAVPFGNEDNWQIFYSWISEPEDSIQVEDRWSSMTIIIKNSKVMLIK